MTLTCELSGQLLLKDAVVTPSGHVCDRALLLQKLTENGGVDPWNQSSSLSEDDLIPLATSGGMPPRTANSMATLLEQVQQEHQALALELFDTRKALEETRQELSQALYQNDAAIRVIARLSSERHAARMGQIEGGTKKRKLNNNNHDDDVAMDATNEDDGELPLTNDLPAQDLQQMLSTWEGLHSGRKAAMKLAATQAPTPEQLASYQGKEKVDLHTKSCKALTAMAVFQNKLVTAGKDKQVVVYDTSTEEVLHKLNITKFASCLDINATHVAVGLVHGIVAVYRLEDGNMVGQSAVATVSVVDVRLHPDGCHVVVASESGHVTLVRLEDTSITAVGVFKSEHEANYACGALHPDGLIYVAGNGFGELVLWDLKNKTLAATLKADDGAQVESLSFSNNGYHLAAAHADGKVCVWDIRKSKLVATFNTEGENLLKTVHVVAFDASGKYLAYGGVGGSRIVSNANKKEWTPVAVLEAHLTSGLVWGSDWVAKFSTKKREVAIYGVPA